MPTTFVRESIPLAFVELERAGRFVSQVVARPACIVESLGIDADLVALAAPAP